MSIHLNILMDVSYLMNPRRDPDNLSVNYFKFQLSSLPHRRKALRNPSELASEMVRTNTITQRLQTSNFRNIF